MCTHTFDESPARANRALCLDLWLLLYFSSFSSIASSMRCLVSRPHHLASVLDEFGSVAGLLGDQRGKLHRPARPGQAQGGAGSMLTVPTHLEANPELDRTTRLAPR